MLLLQLMPTTVLNSTSLVSSRMVKLCVYCSAASNLFQSFVLGLLLCMHNYWFLLVTFEPLSGSSLAIFIAQHMKVGLEDGVDVYTAVPTDICPPVLVIKCILVIRGQIHVLMQ